MASTDRASLLEGAAFSPTKPPPQEVVAALIELEKDARKTRQHYSLSQLVGTWRLWLITGTKKVRSQAAPILGAGRYLPDWVEICLSYTAADEDNSGRGWVKNSVRCGGLEISLSGPIKFLESKNILAFDFTRLNLGLFSLKLYEGFIRGGKTSEENFYSERIGKQAFFAYFLVRENIIAARGRGGGLALWKKVSTDE